MELTAQIVRTAKTRYSFGYLIENNTKLLSRKVTENASRVGEHYISTDRIGYHKMFKKRRSVAFYCFHGDDENPRLVIGAGTDW